MKKLQQTELDKIKNIQSQFTNLLYSLGQIEFELEQITQQKSQILKEIEQLRKLEENFTKELKQKYGDVSLNLETGEITKN
jgi:chromosome segregation ATPase